MGPGTFLCLCETKAAGKPQCFAPYAYFFVLLCSQPWTVRSTGSGLVTLCCSHHIPQHLQRILPQLAKGSGNFPSHICLYCTHAAWQGNGGNDNPPSCRGGTHAKSTLRSNPLTPKPPPPPPRFYCDTHAAEGNRGANARKREHQIAHHTRDSLAFPPAPHSARSPPLTGSTRWGEVAAATHRGPSAGLKGEAKHDDHKKKKGTGFI